MATFNKFQDFVEQLLRGTHNWGAHTFKVVLTNTLPVNTQTSLDTVTNHPAPAAANGYTAGGNTTTITVSEVAGVGKIVGTDPTTWTATAGGIGPFRYAILYNDTATSPADALVAWWDYGSSITLAVGETFTVDFDATNGILTIT